MGFPKNDVLEETIGEAEIVQYGGTLLPIALTNTSYSDNMI